MPHNFNMRPFLTALAVLFLLTGCSSFLLKPKTVPHVQVIPASTNIQREITQAPPVIQVVTQTVAGATIVQTNWIASAPVTNYVPVYVPPQIVTNLQVVGYGVGKIGTVIDNASTLNAAVPTPYSPIIAGILGLATAAATAYAGFKTKQLNKTETKLETAQGVVESIVGAVETFGTPKALSPDLKQHITLTAVDNGNAADVHDAKKSIVGGA